MENGTLVSAVESILFTSGQPVSLARLKEIFGSEGPSEGEIQLALSHIKQRYQDESFGFEVREAQGGFHFCTKVANVDWVRRFLESRPFRLGRSSLEVMAIISYRQPITRAEIDRVRGIDSSHILRTLIEKGIVKMAGKADVPGRPVQYATTPKFLELVGLNSLADLPPLSELQELQGDTPVVEQGILDGMNKFLEVSPGVVEFSKKDETLNEIDGMLKSVQKPDCEVYISPLHAEIGRENEQALSGFQASGRLFRKPKYTVQELEISDPSLLQEPQKTLLESPEPRERL